MPRNYKKKKEKNYDEDLLQTALGEIASGSLTVGKAAKQFGVPKETLRRQTQSGQPFRLGSGRQAVLTPVEENHIAVALDYLGQCGFPQGRETLKEMVQSFIQSVGRKNPFKDDQPADRSAISRRLVINDAASSGAQGEADVHSPRQQLRLSILKVISPPEPPTQAQNKTRKRVQHKSGEILTSEEVLSRLEVEANERNAKKAKKDDKKLEPRAKKRRKNGEAGTSKSKSKTNLDQNFMIFIDGDGSNVENNDGQNDENIDPLEQQHQSLGSRGVGYLQEGESFVIVQYEGSHFPGKVVTLGKNSVTVSCMVKSGITTWRWPDREDVHKYHPNDVIKQIAPPSKCNSRGSYSVPEAEEYWE